MRKARLLHVDEILLIGSFGNVCIIIWRGVPTLAAIERVSVVYARMKSEHAGGYAPLIVVEDGVGLPEESIRQKMAELMDRQGKAILCMAGVQEASGFRGSAIRSVLTAINLISIATYPRKFFATVEQSTFWVVPYASPTSSTPISVPALLESIVELRRENPAKAPR